MQGLELPTHVVEDAVTVGEAFGFTLNFPRGAVDEEAFVNVGAVAVLGHGYALSVPGKRGRAAHGV